MKKKLFSLALALAMCLTLLPLSAFAADDGFSIKDGVLYLYDGPGGDVVIPSGVVKIESMAFAHRKDVTSVTIPDSVMLILHHAFYECSGLTSVTFPSSVGFIQDCAFSGCTALTGVTLPGPVYLGGRAFEGCTALTSVTIKEHASISGYAFEGCTALTSVALPGDVTDIAGHAFDGTPWLAGLGKLPVVNGVLLAYQGGGGTAAIPAGVTHIGAGAFFGCEELTGVTIPNGVTSIGDSAFSGCTGLTGLTIPSSVTSIGVNAFGGCTGLTSVTLPAGVASVGSAVFAGCAGLTSVTLPAGLTSIGNFAFQDCTSLTGLTIPNGVTSIGERAFQSCAGLKSVTIPGSVTSLGVLAFEDCVSLASVTIPAGVTRIPNWIFEGCSGLKSVTIPASVTEIGQEAFRDCSSLTDVYYGGSEAQWKQIDIHGSNRDLTSAAIHCGAPMPEPPGDPAGFTDVKPGDYFADAVAWAVERGITNGATPTTFAPAESCTHAQILTFLYRADRGQGKAEAADMDKAVSWAMGKGMIDAGFDGSKPCTRADAVSYIWQALGKEDAPASSFTDVDPNASCAKAVDWAVANGITNGDNAAQTEFSPNKVCTRGHIVTFLHRACVPAARLK